jgi:hypothetical protein
VSVASASPLAVDAEFGARVAAIFVDPDAYPVPPRPGPPRRELLDALPGSTV